MRSRLPSHPRRWFTLTPLLALLLAAVTACTSGAPTAVPVPSPTTAPVSPTATATVVRPTVTPLPSPTARVTATPVGLPSLQPPGARTGISQLDAMVDAFLSNSLEAKRKLVRFLTTPCTTAFGMGGPPKCAAGEANGTLVEVFPFATTEGEFARRDSVDRVLQFEVAGLYGVYRAPAAAFPADYWPAGEYAIVFAGWGDPSRTTTDVIQTIVYVQDGAVVRLRRTPFAAPWPPQEAAGAAWVLPPVR